MQADPRKQILLDLLVGHIVGRMPQKTDIHNFYSEELAKRHCINLASI